MNQPSASLSPATPSLITVLGIAMLPHLPDLPGWIIAWVAISWAWCLLAAQGRLPFPGKLMRLLLTVTGILLTLADSGGTLDGAAFIGVMCVMAGLKPLEIATYRDQIVTAFLAYVIIITGLFKTESLAVTVYMFFSVWLTTAALIRINHPLAEVKATARLSARMMLQALPIMLVLFFLFPRFQFTLWGPRLSQEGKSGFTDTLTPGGVSRIARDDTAAFRVTFDGPAPPYHRRYFRGIVFWLCDGETWSRGADIPLARHPLAGNNEVSYAIILEPHGQRWLFSLDLPLKAPRQALIHADQTIAARHVVREKARYSLTSYLDYRTQDFQRWEKAALALPPGQNPQTRALAQSWAEAVATPEQIIQQGLAFFEQHPFEYTLNPPKLGKNPMDQFLFETRKGYCEHYASAFAWLMRAAGVPARLVGGYLGGEPNPYRDYYLVRQSDAHVWVEVFLENSGWTRIDPTAVVAPGRIQQGIENVLRSGEVPDFLKTRRFGWISSFMHRFRLGWDAVSTEWDIWFSSYSFQTQRELLNRLGIRIGSSAGMRAFLFLLLVGVLSIGGWAAIRMTLRVRTSTDEVLSAYQEFCRKLAAIGLERRPSQGPRDYALMVAAARNDLQHIVDHITGAYIRLRYADQRDPQSIRAFRKIIARFKPKTLKG